MKPERHLHAVPDAPPDENAVDPPRTIAVRVREAETGRLLGWAQVAIEDIDDGA